MVLFGMTFWPNSFRSRAEMSGIGFLEVFFDGNGTSPGQRLASHGDGDFFTGLQPGQHAWEVLPQVSNGRALHLKRNASQTPIFQIHVF